MSRAVLIPLMICAACSQSNGVDHAAKLDEPLTEQICLALIDDQKVLACFAKLNEQTQLDIQDLQAENEALDKEISEGFGAPASGE